jgi:diguanylate cyclase (GGDEF)-like protein
MARREEDAYALMADALERLPRIKDPEAREEGLLEASEMYGDAGQYDLSLRYAQTVIDENWNGRGRCEGGSQQVRALQAAGRLDDEDRIIAVIQYCKRVHELLYASQARMALADLYRRQHRYDDAIRVLATHYDEVQRLYNPRLLVAYNAQLAQVYYNRGLLSLAGELARRVALSSIDRFSASLASAYQVLYEISRDQGDFHTALAFHEKFAEVDKAYLDEVSARALAFQRVTHESLAKQLELETLNRRNRLLQLQTQLSEASAKGSGLKVALLTVVLSFMGALAALIALWAYRTKRAQLHFMTLSRMDSLTGIYNRPYFIEQADSLLEHSRRAGLEVSVVLWDADHFKGVNDRYGHAAGDSVLKRLAQACKSKLRRTDILGRFGGEEFVVMLPGCSAEEAAERAEIMRSGMCQVPVLENRADSDTVSASFGVTCTRMSGYELGRLLGHADAALYAAKGAGRNCVVIYNGTGGPGPESGGKAGGPMRARRPASHVHGVQARHRPASRRR